MIINWGDAPFKAYITVTYPMGSCTLTDGKRSYSHQGGGTCTFTVGRKCTWTISCSYENLVSEKTVTPTVMGESISVDMDYRFYIFKQGEGLAKSITSRNLYRTHSVSTDQIAIENNYGVHTYASFYPVDLTGYNRMYMHAYHAVNYSEPLRFGVGTAGEGQDAEAEKATNKKTGEGTWELDISGLSGEKSVFVGTNCEYAYVYNWWLEP